MVIILQPPSAKHLAIPLSIFLFTLTHLFIKTIQANTMGKLSIGMF